MSSFPTVSLVIPAYNAEGTIRSAVDSALAQTRPADEVLVVDDGSTDGTAELLLSYGDRIRVVSQPNGGLAAARNTGHAATVGDFVAWLDADDIAHPERLEVQLAVMQTRPEVVLVSSDFSAFNEEGPVADRYAKRYYGALRAPGALERILGPATTVEACGRAWPFHAGEARTEVIFGNFVHPPTVMIRRSAIDRAGPVEDAFAVSEDWLYFVELSALGPIAFIDEPLLDYRRSPDQMSSIETNGPTVILNNLAAFERLLARHPELATEHPDRVRKTMGSRYASAAVVLSEQRRTTALGYALRALWNGAPRKPVLNALAKILTPSPIIAAIRRAKSR